MIHPQFRGAARMFQENGYCATRYVLLWTGLVSSGIAANTCVPDLIVGAKYPHLPRSARIEGVVRLSLTIAPDGKVADTKRLSGHVLLTKFVESELREWRFPSRGDCTTIEIQWIFTLKGTRVHLDRIEERFVFRTPNTVEIISEMPIMRRTESEVR